MTELLNVILTNGRNKVFVLWICGMVFCVASCMMTEAKEQSPGQASSDDRIGQRVDSLLSLMTMKEKVGQLVQYSAYAELTGPGQKDEQTKRKYDRIRTGGVGSLLNVVNTASAREAQDLALQSRLAIPLMFGYDVIHGFRTMFPVPLGEAASWDLEAIEQAARISAIEASAAGIHWTFAPMVDVSRDGRWGRIMEGAGEDPYLCSLVAAARVRGFQGNDLSNQTTIATCPKHFAGYGFAEAGRDYNTVDISNQTLYNVILPPFKAAIQAGAVTVMSAFNEIGGIPASGHTHLLRNVLKEQWGFTGFVVSDWGSIYEMTQHGFAEDRRAASFKGIVAGIDMDMEGNCYDTYLVELVKKGTIDESLVDDAVRRVLRVKFMLGIMDDPYKYINAKRENENIYTDEHRQFAREAARKSIVLLKNEKLLLPLEKKGGPIAVIGPLAKDKDTPLGNWRGQAISNSAVSLFGGIENAILDRKILYSEGCKLSVGPRTFANELVLNEHDRSGFKEAKTIARQAEVVILAIGEDSQQSGEGRSQANIGLAGLQQELLEEIYAVNRNIIVVLMNGRPLEITWIAEHAPAIVEAWHLGSEAGNAIADILFGDYNPSGRLPVTFPRSEGQLPVYYAHKNTGRPGPLEDEVFWSHYTDESNEPLFPFGFGLSYTTFTYSDISLSMEEITQDQALEVSVDVTNTGNREGREIVQLYIRDLVASETRPVKELKAFKLINLLPGQLKTITFKLGADDLSFFGSNGETRLEPGAFHVFIGPDSRDVKRAVFRLSDGKNDEKI